MSRLSHAHTALSSLLLTATGSTSVTWGDSGTYWPALARFQIERLKKASEPVTGTWELSDGVVSELTQTNH